MEARSGNNCSRGKALSITYCKSVSVFLVVLVVQINRIFSAQRCVVFCDLAGATILFILSHKLRDFRENVLNIKCVLIISNFVCNFSHSKNNSAKHYQKYT